MLYFGRKPANKGQLRLLQAKSKDGGLVVGYGINYKPTDRKLYISGAFIIDETDYCFHADKTKVEIGYFGLYGGR